VVVFIKIVGDFYGTCMRTSVLRHTRAVVDHVRGENQLAIRIKGALFGSDDVFNLMKVVFSVERSRQGLAGGWPSPVLEILRVRSYEVPTFQLLARVPRPFLSMKEDDQNHDPYDYCENKE